MKNTFILCAALVICMVLINGCNKDESPNPTNDEPLVTPVGTPAGVPVTASIDANGGTLSSADGLLQITIPAGAISGATVFSIQPVSNQCPGGFGMAYRLLPDGTIFAQPVSLVFSYTDTLLSNEKFLAIAYQGDDNSWLAPEVISLQEASNKISLQTNHFTDWALFQKITINPLTEKIKVNGSIDLEVILVSEAKIIKDPLGDKLASLNIGTHVSEWEVNGTIGNENSGFIVKTSPTDATYHAPAKVPSQNPVAVSATLKNISFTLNGESFSNPEVIAHIKVLSEKSRFHVQFSSSRILLPVGNSWFTETDAGSMEVLLENDTVIVYALVNQNASLDPTFLFDEGAECTYAVVDFGDGPFNISPGVNFGGIYNSFDDIIRVGINTMAFPYSTGFNPSYEKSCTGGVRDTLPGEQVPTAPFEFSFDVTELYQEFNQVIPGGGFFPDGFLKTAITRIE